MRMSRFNSAWRSSTSDVVADLVDDRHSSGHCAAPGGPVCAPTPAQIRRGPNVALSAWEPYRLRSAGLLICGQGFVGWPLRAWPGRAVWPTCGPRAPLSVAHNAPELARSSGRVRWYRGRSSVGHLPALFPWPLEPGTVPWPPPRARSEPGARSGNLRSCRPLVWPVEDLAKRTADYSYVGCEQPGNAS
jgi:hypothetical protein